MLQPHVYACFALVGPNGIENKAVVKPCRRQTHSMALPQQLLQLPTDP